MGDKIKILFAGDSLSYMSGLGYVAASVMERFRRTGKYEIAYLTLGGVDTQSDTIDMYGDSFKENFSNIKFYNCQCSKANYYQLVDKAIEDFSPKIVFTIHDPWVIDALAYSSLRESFVLVNYVTIETPEYPEVVMQPSPVYSGQRKSIKDSLSKSDLLIPVTKMGKTALINLGLSPSDNIYLGIDIDTICKTVLPKKEAFSNIVNDDDFIFMTMGVNAERKRIDKVVEAFYKFRIKMNNNNKYKLYIHSDLDVGNIGTDIRAMVSSLKMTECVLTSTWTSRRVKFEKSTLYARYSACDCCISLASGEGMNYLAVEAMAHGKPVIYTNYGGHVEFCNTSGLPVDVKTFVYARDAYIKWAIADTDHAAKQMARIVSDRHLRDVLSVKGKEIALKEFDWNKNCERIEKMVFDVFNKISVSSFAGISLKRII